MPCLAELSVALLVSGSLLALRAEVAAAACNNDATNGSFATQAWLPFAVVDAVVMLVIAGNAVGIEEIGNGRAAEGDGLAKNFLEFGVEELNLCRLQAGAALSGMNFGAP